MDTKNILIPKHRKLSQEEVTELLNAYSIEGTNKLPRIKIKDSALSELGVEVGDVIEVTRSSFAGSNNKYYRVVVE